MDAASSFLCKSIRIPSTAFTFARPPENYVCLVSNKRDSDGGGVGGKVFCSGVNGGSNATKKKPRRKSNVSDKLRSRKIEKRNDSESVSVSSETVVDEKVEENKKNDKELSLGALNQNGDPLGRRDLGGNVVKWISQAMKAMASDFATAEVQGEFSELRQNAGSGLTFVIQALRYLNAIPMPLGLEVICLKACTQYPTLFDHFQRELRDVLQELERKNLIENWKETESWKLLKEIANSDIHSVFAPSVDEQVLMARIVSVEDEESDIEDVVADTWKKHLIDEGKPIFWKEFFNMDVATRIEEERVQAAATENVAPIGLVEHIQSLKKTMYDGFLQIGASIDDIDKRLKSVEEFMKETRGEGQQQESYQWAEEPNQSTQEPKWPQLPWHEKPEGEGGEQGEPKEKERESEEKQELSKIKTMIKKRIFG